MRARARRAWGSWLGTLAAAGLSLLVAGWAGGEEPQEPKRKSPFEEPTAQDRAAWRQPSAIPPDRPYALRPHAKLEPNERRLEVTGEYRLLRVEFNGVEGDRVPARLYLPTQGRAPYPAVLLQYGSGGRKETDYIVKIGKHFARAGFAVLTIDVPGRGERRTPGQRDPVLRQFRRDVFVQYLGDYARAVDYLQSRDDVKSRSIAYVGISWGAITGIVYAAHDPRVRVVVSIVGGGRFLGLLGGGRRLPALQRRSLDPVDHVRLIAPRPLLLVNVTRDQLVPRPFGQALHAAAGDAARKIWLDTDHFFRGVDVPKFLHETVIPFVREGLEKAPPPDATAAIQDAGNPTKAAGEKVSQPSSSPAAIHDAGNPTKAAGEKASLPPDSVAPMQDADSRAKATHRKGPPSPASRPSSASGMP